MRYRRFLLIFTLAAGLCLGSAACAGTTPTTGGDFTVTSSTVLGHSHRVTITGADLTSPPAEGRTLTTTTDAGHSHTVALARTDYETIAQGQTVTVTTGVTSGHTHQFTIRKPA